jgi:adenylate cyclase
MLVGRASFVRVYADEISSLNALETFRVFDKDGFERFLNPPPRSRKQLADVLSSKAPLEFVENSGEDEEMVRLSPLANESRCFTCHGKTHAIRAVVEVSSSMKEINKAIRDNQIRSAGIGILTLLLVWGTIRLFMRTVVIKPVQAIGNIADRIGKGDLSARAELDSEDEIGKLAVRMNEMVQGLRERLHLTRFVSQQTVEAVRRAPGTGLQLGGERKTATVFFSDIRGFTSFSERVQPEFVVSMLNEILSKQARIVRKYEGDIDKYVGDELVAVFSGDGMVERAVLAALEIQEAVPTQIGSEILKIGIGINTGDMIMGAMGSADRMDYTVIGDSVNLGARLCSAAPGGQIYLSEYSASHLGESREFALAPLEPISVKGKKDPIRIFVVHRSTQPQASAEVPPSE